MTAELLTEANGRVPGRRWRIAWLLGIGILVNYFDRVNLSAAHGALVTAFGISDVAVPGGHNLKTDGGTGGKSISCDPDQS